jgi:hypothetical protein
MDGPSCASSNITMPNLFSIFNVQIKNGKWGKQPRWFSLWTDGFGRHLLLKWKGVYMYLLNGMSINTAAEAIVDNDANATFLCWLREFCVAWR